MIFIFKE